MLDFLIGNDLLSAIVAFGLVLIPAIFIHELGHFLAAKAVGITILEFGIGFPPRMAKLFTWGETEYTLNWLPIGGFVRPLGEDFVRPVSSEEVTRDREKLREMLGDEFADVEMLTGDRAALRKRGIRHTRSVNEARPLARIGFMAAGSTANLITAILLFIIIGLLGLPTIVGGSAGIVYLTPDSAIADVGLQAGDIIEKVNGEYFDNVQDLSNLLTVSDSAVTLTVQRLNSAETFDVAYSPTSESFKNLVFVSGVAPNSPAEAAGLQADDLIIAFNGEGFAAFEDLPERTQARLGEEVTLTVLRDGIESEISLVPRVNPPEGEGSIGIGIIPAYENLINDVILVEGGFQQELVPLTLGEAVQYSFERVVFFLETLVSLPAEIMGGQLSSEETRLMSPIAISQFGGVFLQQSIEQNQPVVILNYIAIISIALGITNLLPLPALDGGRIVFVVLEIIRGRPIAPEREGIVHLIGMALLLSLMALAFLNDIFNPISTNLLP